MGVVGLPMNLRLVLCCGAPMVFLGAGALWLLWALSRKQLNEKSQPEDVQTVFTPPNYEGLEPPLTLIAGLGVFEGTSEVYRLLILLLYSPTSLDAYRPLTLSALSSPASHMGVFIIGMAAMFILALYLYAIYRYYREEGPGGG